MAKGIPLMGRDPDGKAKMINVDENGNVKVQQSGNIVELASSSIGTLARRGFATLLANNVGNFAEFIVSVRASGTGRLQFMLYTTNNAIGWTSHNMSADGSLKVDRTTGMVWRHLTFSIPAFVAGANLELRVTNLEEFGLNDVRLRLAGRR